MTNEQDRTALELEAMQFAYDALSRLTPDERARAWRWLDARFTDEATVRREP